MPSRLTPTRAAHRAGVLGAAATLLGIVLSGPVAIVALEKTHPQPPWQGAEVFAQHYHFTQAAPYWAGFFLVGGYVVLIAALHALAPAVHRARANMALVFTAVFGAMVFFNYVLQTTFVPQLVRGDVAANAQVIGAFSMANPRSLAWGLEMWGYGFLGVATWLVAPVLSGSPLERATAWLFVANGVTSVLSAALTGLAPGWVLTAPGVAGFVAWNVLVFAMSACALTVLRRRARAEAASGAPAAPAAEPPLLSGPALPGAAVS